MYLKSIEVLKVCTIDSRQRPLYAQQAPEQGEPALCSKHMLSCHVSHWQSRILGG